MSLAVAPDRRVKTPITYNGAHGLGDNLHQRACVRQMLQKHEVWLYTSWPCVYHDFVGDGLHFVRKDTPLRTQTKNARREAHLFEPAQRGPVVSRTNPSPSEAIKRLGTVLAAMCEQWGADYSTADFRLPVADSWVRSLKALHLEQNTKPLLVLRPLTVRPKDWRGCNSRNPDHAAYAELYQSIRERFFVVSIADLEDNYEWIVGDHLRVDIEFHKGELRFEQMAALFSIADIVFTSAGFAVILAQAVGTPVAAIFGGYEDHRSFLGGAPFAPYLGIDPIQPCRCFSHNHACQKAIDMPTALARLHKFVGENVTRT